MIEIIALICMMDRPARCREIELATDARTPMQCLMYAQPMLAEWANSHPFSRVAKFRCSGNTERA